VYNRFKETGFAIFEELGSYTVLYNLNDSLIATLFIKKYLSPLMRYSGGKGADLFYTLRVYLNMNGSLKDTADFLYIHRSSLQYRLERIRSTLGINIDDAEERFNLMMAYKLYDLYDSSPQ
jgi:purine catabolism regulator